MEAAVGKLPDGLERELVEGAELAHAREVEEPVASDLARDVPEQQPEHDSTCGDPPPRGRQAK